MTLGIPLRTVYTRLTSQDGVYQVNLSGVPPWVYLSGVPLWVYLSGWSIPGVNLSGWSIPGVNLSGVYPAGYTSQVGIRVGIPLRW